MKPLAWNLPHHCIVNANGMNGKLMNVMTMVNVYFTLRQQHSRLHQLR